MSLAIYEPLLETCAETGNIDYDAWPAILPIVLDRLDTIAHNEFPIPRPYPILNPVLPSQRSTDPDQLNDNPPTLPSNTPKTPRTNPPPPLFPGSSASRIPDSQPQIETAQNVEEQNDKLPVEVVQLLEQSLKTLKASFSEKPPHTIQRLSELVLYPTKHYKTLPAWLRALDRVVSVSSGADVFPLSDIPPNIGNGVLNGSELGGILFPNSANETRNGYDKDSLGSDESLGGALLTPIPWLKDSDFSSSTDSGTLDSTSKIDSWHDQSPEEEMLSLSEDSMAATADAAQAIAAVAQEHNGGGSIPERPQGGVTQGELIRMEQEAGVVPVPHEDIHRIGDEDIEIDDDGDNMPHARGPDLVGTVDMGKVEGQERQLRISSPPDETMNRGDVDANDAQDILPGGRTRDKSGSGEKSIDDTAASIEDFVKIDKEDAKSKTGSSSDDGDIVLVDADGAAEDSEKADATGVNIGADAADSTTQ